MEEQAKKQYSKARLYINETIRAYISANDSGGRRQVKTFIKQVNTAKRINAQLRTKNIEKPATFVDGLAYFG